VDASLEVEGVRVVDIDIFAWEKDKGHFHNYAREGLSQFMVDEQVASGEEKLADSSYCGRRIFIYEYSIGIIFRYIG
jgi:hypothetical protein